MPPIRPAAALFAIATVGSTLLAREAYADPDGASTTRVAQAQPAPQPTAAQPAPAQPPPGYGAPPPGYGPPPPGYGAPPPGYAPPGYYYGAATYGPPLPPPVPKERFSTGMMVGGIVLASAGLVSLLVGSVLYSQAEQAEDVDRILCDPSFENCNREDHDDQKTTGIALMIAGGAGIAVGIPLLIVGARKVPVGDAPSSSSSPAASLRLGPGKGALRVTF